MIRCKTRVSSARGVSGSARTCLKVNARPPDALQGLFVLERRLPSPDSLLSGTELHYLCRSGSEHPTEAARSEDSEMRMARDEQRWLGPRVIPLVPVKPPCWGPMRIMSKHVRRKLGRRTEDSGKRKKERLLKGECKKKNGVPGNNCHIKYIIKSCSVYLK